MALQLIGICITDGVMPFNPEQYGIQCSTPLDEIIQNRDCPIDIGLQLTVNVAIKQLCEMLEMVTSFTLNIPCLCICSGSYDAANSGRCSGTLDSRIEFPM